MEVMVPGRLRPPRDRRRSGLRYARPSRASRARARRAARGSRRPPRSRPAPRRPGGTASAVCTGPAGERLGVSGDALTTPPVPRPLAGYSAPARPCRRRGGAARAELAVAAPASPRRPRPRAPAACRRRRRPTRSSPAGCRRAPGAAPCRRATAGWRRRPRHGGRRRAGGRPPARRRPARPRAAATPGCGASQRFSSPCAVTSSRRPPSGTGWAPAPRATGRAGARAAGRRARSSAPPGGRRRARGRPRRRSVKASSTSPGSAATGITGRSSRARSSGTRGRASDRGHAANAPELEAKTQTVAHEAAPRGRRLDARGRGDEADDQPVRRASVEERSGWNSVARKNGWPWSSTTRTSPSSSQPVATSGPPSS